MHTKSFTEIDEVESKVKEHQPDVLVCPLPSSPNSLGISEPPSPTHPMPPSLQHPTFGKISD